MAEVSLLQGNPDVAEVNRSVWKLVVAIVVPVITAAGASYLFFEGNMTWSCVLILLFINFLALQTFFLKTSSQVWLVLSLSAIVLVAPFFSVSIDALTTAALVILFFFVIGAFSGRHELDNSLKLTFSRVTRKVMVGGITGIVGGMIVLAIAGAPGMSMFSVDNIAKYVVDPYLIAPAMQYAMHQQYIPNETARDFLTSEIEASSIPVNGTSISIGSLSPGKTKDQIMTSLIDSSVAQLESSIGAPIDLDSSISVNVIRISENKISQLGQPTQLGVILLLYLTLWSVVAFLATILSYILTISAFLIFEFLIMTNFAEIQIESRSHEIVTLQ